MTAETFEKIQLNRTNLETAKSNLSYLKERKEKNNEFSVLLAGNKYGGQFTIVPELIAISGSEILDIAITKSMALISKLETEFNNF